MKKKSLLSDTMRRELAAAPAQRTEPVSRIKEACRLAGITQRTLAADIGMTEPHVSEISRGVVKDVMLTTAYRFSRYFGVSIEELFPERRP